MTANPRLGLAVLLVTLAPAIAPAQDAPPNPFDGRWATTVSCKAGTAYQFVTEVRDGILHGSSGTEGEPGYFQIDGKITPGGLGHVYAKGLARKGTISGRDVAPGTEYKYYAQAKFERATGSGSRVGGSPCEFKFVKK